jgi:hypothetical protein
MKSKKRGARQAPPLMEFEVVEITDPAEIAALEERIREAEAAFAAAAANSGKAKSVKKRPRNGSVPPAA